MTEPVQQSTFQARRSTAAPRSAETERTWWESLRHFGLLLGPSQVSEIDSRKLAPLPDFIAYQLRRELTKFEALQDEKEKANPGPLVAWILENVCGFENHIIGRWLRGGDVPSEYSHQLVTGSKVRPRHLWIGPHGAILPVFFDDTEHRLGLYKSRKRVSDVVQWLRVAGRPLALVTNGRQLRLLYAGLDFHAACEWDFEQLFEAGAPGPQLEALRRLLTPEQLTPPAQDEDAPLLEAIQAARRGQAELSSTLGERVREAVEYLVQGHGSQLAQTDYADQGAEIYRAAVRVVMRMVFILFAESRDLLPRANPVYTVSYGLQSLFEDLDRLAARSDGRLRHRHGAWPRVLALFRLVYRGSHHQALPLKGYGGDLFAPGEATSSETWRQALHLLETACFEKQGGRDLMPDFVVHKMLERLTRTRIKVRQGSSRTWTTVPVDFSDLSSEYIGILYEGLLDYELRQAPADDPVVFLAVGNEPALPLSRLESLSDQQVRNLFENLKDVSGSDEVPPEEELELEEDQAEEPEEEDELEEDHDAEDEGEDLTVAEQRHAAKERARAWTRKAAEVAGLVKKPRGKTTPEKRAEYERKLEKKAASLVRDLFLPGDWYLVRWGGTRKGAGTYYTRPQLAVPLAHRTLKPLCYEEREETNPSSNLAPRRPEELLELKVCDPACGSGTFPLAALRYITDALYASLHHHGRLETGEDRTMAVLLGKPEEKNDGSDSPPSPLSAESIPVRQDHPDFELLLRARLKRHVVERCIYGVDIDPLAVELCKLALWIETMDRELPFTFLDHKIKAGDALVGCWFDRFQHYPAMAWKRDAGDKGHTNGVHFEKGERSKAIKQRCGNTRIKEPETVRMNQLHLLEEASSGQMKLFTADEVEQASHTHGEALRTLRELHELAPQEAEERARRYRDDMLQSPDWKALKDRFNLWCALWFWPADELRAAPLPTEFANPSKETLKRAREISASQSGFFHWELEFPDVFDAPGSGFDAVLGNPPWETLQPNSKEYFSNLDPLYRSYGRQEALRRQTNLFEQNPDVEADWLDFNAKYASLSNYFNYAAFPYGDAGKEESDNFSVCLGSKNKELHAFWARLREKTPGYADPEHPFRYQGFGKAYTYKLFLESSWNLLSDGGRLGLIVPSGLYSDYGTDELRGLFIERSKWEWLFGFENRNKIFDIDSRFKFNPVIVEKGGKTEEIQAAFMHRRLEDWEEADEHAVPYTREQVARFSPNSRAILEIQSELDLEILDTIYSNSVLLGDTGPDGWGIEYAQGDFNMTSDSKLFPPRHQWEERGYRPDEYSRWLQGDWQRRTLSSPAPTGGKRVEIPEGIILSRDGEAWIDEENVEDVALPLYQGRMIWQLDSSRTFEQDTSWDASDWPDKPIAGSYLMGAEHWPEAVRNSELRVGFRDVQNATNQRTFIATPLAPCPCGNKVPLLGGPPLTELLCLTAAFVSFPADRALRIKMSQGTLNWFYVEEVPIAKQSTETARITKLRSIIALALSSSTHASVWCQLTRNRSRPWKRLWAASNHERLRLRSTLDAISISDYGLTYEQGSWLLRECSFPIEISSSRATRRFDQKGFWRVDKDKDPELRHTVLTLVAFHDLQEKIREHGGDREKGIEAFCNQNGGEGWMLPETLRLADYGLGHDDRADRPQPVASRLGPRFYDWQLEQDPEESWRECELHARNLLGPDGYRELKDEIEGRRGRVEEEKRGSSIEVDENDRLSQIDLF